MSTELDIETQIDDAIKELIEPTKKIILYNDDYNTFEHVIICLIKYCEHSVEQAEQCAITVHNNGKCDVKRGSEKKLKPIYETLLDKGLKVKIEE